jgi:hypothetical protein
LLSLNRCKRGLGHWLSLLSTFGLGDEVEKIKTLSFQKRSYNFTIPRNVMSKNKAATQIQDEDDEPDEW